MQSVVTSLSDGLRELNAKSARLTGGSAQMPDGLCQMQATAGGASFGADGNVSQLVGASGLIHSGISETHRQF